MDIVARIPISPIATSISINENPLFFIMFIPAYNNYRSNANDAVLKSDAGNAYKAYHAKNAVDGHFCADLSAVGLDSMKESSTYSGEKSFVGFAASDATCGVSSNLNKVSSVNPTTNRAQCLLGRGTFKFSVINQFDNKEVSFSVSNDNSSPQQGGAYCKKSTTDTTAASSDICHKDSTECTKVSNNCKGGATNTAGVWVSNSTLCR